MPFWLFALSSLKLFEKKLENVVYLMLKISSFLWNHQILPVQDLFSSSTSKELSLDLIYNFQGMLVQKPLNQNDSVCPA